MEKADPHHFFWKKNSWVLIVKEIHEISNLGMKYFPEMSEKFKCLDKYFGRSLSEAELHAVISAFFAHSKLAVQEVLKKVDNIKEVIYFKTIFYFKF